MNTSKYQRRLYLSSEIDYGNTQELIAKIHEYNEIDEKSIAISDAKSNELQPINLYIDSQGGLIQQCFSIICTVLDSKTPIHTHVLGTAMSSAMFISTCGAYRTCYDYSLFMYHQVSDSVEGTLKQLADNVILTKKLQKKIDDILISRTHLTRNILTRKQDTDWYIDSHAALKLGIVDKIIEFS